MNKPPNLSTVGLRLRHARRCRSWSVVLVGKYSAVHPRMLDRYESGEHPIPHDVLRLLVYLYDVPMLWALGQDKTLPCEMPEERLRARWRDRPHLADMPR